MFDMHGKIAALPLATYLSLPVKNAGLSVITSAGEGGKSTLAQLMLEAMQASTDTRQLKTEGIHPQIAAAFMDSWASPRILEQAISFGLTSADNVDVLLEMFFESLFGKEAKTSTISRAVASMIAAGKRDKIKALTWMLAAEATTPEVAEAEDNTAKTPAQLYSPFLLRDSDDVEPLVCADLGGVVVSKIGAKLALLNPDKLNKESFFAKVQPKGFTGKWKDFEDARDEFTELLGGIGALLENEAKYLGEHGGDSLFLLPRADENNPGCSTIWTVKPSRAVSVFLDYDDAAPKVEGLTSQEMPDSVKAKLAALDHLSYEPSKSVSGSARLPDMAGYVNDPKLLLSAVSALEGMALHRVLSTASLYSEIFTIRANAVSSIVAFARQWSTIFEQTGQIALVRTEMIADALYGSIAINTSLEDPHTLLRIRTSQGTIRGSVDVSLLDAAKGALIPYEMVHISVLNQTVFKDLQIKSSTQSGGLESALLDALQDFNDDCYDLGRHAIAEMRDDFITSAVDVVDEATMDKAMKKLSSSSRFTFLLGASEDKNSRSLNIRVRKYNSDNFGDSSASFGSVSLDQYKFE